MFGGQSKLGRGGVAGRGVGGAPKRCPALSQTIRPPGPAPSHRSMPGPRNRTPVPPAPPTALEETFSLVSGENPHAFAMIIRLAPDLIEEIRRVEAQDGAARIKFDVNPNNPTGNVIDVGGKEFRFTWSKDFGDLCDIYEERQNGEDGNGLLVESGSAWRKLNVQRVLDESTTNLVKMRSAEAERKKEQRKAIILDHGNRSMKSQIKQATAANPWRAGFKKKEPPQKKQKVDSPLVPSGAALKPTQKSGSTPSSSKSIGMGPCSVSPLPPPQNPLQVVPSPSGGQNILKATEEIIVPTQLRNEDSDRDILIKSSGLQDKSCSKFEVEAKPPDLQSMITSLLKENPRGMSFKGLEKAIGDTFSSSGKMIEPILKRIAVYQAPGKYLLKQGSEAEGTKGLWPRSTSSFNDKIQIRTSASKPTFDKEVRQDEGIAELNNTTELDALENIDNEQHSPDVLGNKKDSVRDSSVDSDSMSSDSGSPSVSQSKSQTPVHSGGSSDSESDNSSSKEGSDEEVDIMSSDDDNLKPGQDPGSVAPSPLIPNDNNSDIVDIDGDVNEEHAESARVGGSLNQHEVEAPNNLIESLFHEDEFAFGGANPTARGESERGSGSKNDDVAPEWVKQSRTENLSTLPVHGRYSSSPNDSTPDWNHEMTKLPSSQTVSGKLSNLHPQQPVQRLSSQQPMSYDSSWKINIHGGPGEISGQVGPFSDKSFNADSDWSSKRPPEGDGSRSSRCGPSVRHSLPFESHWEVGPGQSFKESPCVNRRSPVLQREVSDLELGELRESMPEECPTKKQFERKGSFNGNRPKPLPKSENFTRKRNPEQIDDNVALPQLHIPSRASNVHGTSPIGNIMEVNIKKNGILAAQVCISDMTGLPKINNRSTAVPHRTKKETTIQAVGANGRQKRKESSSDENSCSYLKYEKDMPELKRRIRDLPQYYEYVQEYRNKYDSYCSLNKVLESYREDFLNLGWELESAKGGRDMDRYNNIVSQIMDSYTKCGTNHKRLKKIFTVLHQELKHLKRMITDFAAS